MILIKKISLVVIMVLTTVSTFACQTSQTLNTAVYQKDISRIAQFRSELPENYNIIDFKEKALAYDEMVFNFEATDTFFPLIWQDNTYDAYGISAYIGDYRNGLDGSQEAVTSIAAVLSATLMGIDKTNQNGHNFVTPLNVYFNQAEGVVINNPSGNSRNISMWYMIYPAILFTQVSIQYETETLLRQNALTTIESWYQAYEVMHALNDFDYTGFDFESMQPYRNNIWKEPDSAVGISLLMYYGYQLTGLEKYKTAAINTMTYIDQSYNGSSMYEILLYYGPYLAAMYNQAFDTNFDVFKLFNQAFNGNSIPRGGWGMLNDNYNGFAVSGLMGSITDGGGYAFSMNSFASAFIMAKTAKYDTRYANSIGQWLNHLISNARYFFPDYAKDENESMYHTDYSTETIAFNEAANSVFPYEGIRKSGSGKSPWFGGDPTVYNWAQTDLSVYSGASMGMLASMYEKTDVEGILKIDLNAGDYYNNTYPTYLLYNPNDSLKSVTYEPKHNNVDLYDSVTQTIIKENVSGSTKLDINSNSSYVIIELPTGSSLTKRDHQVLLNDDIISTAQVTLNILNYENNAEVSTSFTLKVDTITPNSEDEVLYYEVILDGKVTKYDTSDLKISTTSGSKTLVVRVYTKNGLTDYLALRVRVK